MAREKSPNEIEAELRKSAEKFADAVDAARAAGFTVSWPGNGATPRALEIISTGVIADDGTQTAEAERQAAAAVAAKPTDKT